MGGIFTDPAAGVTNRIVFFSLLPTVVVTRSFVWIVCLGLLGILIVSVAAPVLPTAVSVIDDDHTIDPPELDDDGEQLVEEYAGEQPGGGEGSSLPTEWLLLGVAVASLVILARVGLANPAKSMALLALGIVAIASVLGWLAVGGWGAETGSADAIPDTVSLVVTVVLLVLAIGGTAVVLARSTTETPSLEPTFDTVQRRQDPPAADTFPAIGVSSTTNRPADNDVYRTWQAVTESVGKGDDDTATPGDIRAAAIDHGFDSETIDELQRLFEDSRYGARNATPEREQRARELRRELKSTDGDPDA